MLVKLLKVTLVPGQELAGKEKFVCGSGKVNRYYATLDLDVHPSAVFTKSTLYFTESVQGVKFSAMLNPVAF